MRTKKQDMLLSGKKIKKKKKLRKFQRRGYLSHVKVQIKYWWSMQNMASMVDTKMRDILCPWSTHSPGKETDGAR